jgi:hypothetical protein
VFHNFLYAELWDDDAVTDDFLGEAFFPLRALVLAGSNTAAAGACDASSPSSSSELGLSFTLPLQMPAHRRPKAIGADVDTRARGACGTVTVHVRCAAASAVADMLVARHPPDAQQVRNGGGGHSLRRTLTHSDVSLDSLDS